ncbi:hypothetical protein [Streptomyces sp. NPDC047046]|uniref:hypothetical protein n=1 Tax=Streptomyces sp. NPDC047046 TaxID=3155378 RepID=UPI0033F9D211
MPLTSARLRRATALSTGLIRRPGPEPSSETWTSDSKNRDSGPHDFDRLPPDMKLVLVGCARLTRSVIRAQWGASELRTEDRYLI